METKLCKSCGLLLPLNSYNKKKENKDGLNTICKNCYNVQRKQYYEKNKSRISETRKKHYQKNIDKMRLEMKKYCAKTKKLKSEYDKIYREKNKLKISEYKKKWAKERLKNDPRFKILGNLRRRLLHVLKGYSKADSTLNLLGCTKQELIQYLESIFKEGMTWENYGQFGWHIDHITPCSFFDLSIVEQQQKCFHYTNLQPLWWYENLTKGKK
jgi:hypothetical protein